MFKKSKNIIIILIAIISIFTAAHFVLAQDLGIGYASNLGLGNADPRVMAVNIVRIALTFIGIIAVCVIIYAGWLWMTAAGSPEKIDKAKKTLIGAVIGLIIILSAWAIVTFIINKMGEVTGDTCEFGVDPPKACTGCEGAGTQDCLASNTWGPCNTDCSGAAPCCCSGLCLACPCPFTPPVFVINVFSPPDLAVDVIRNKVIRVTFSNNIDSDTVDGSFRLIKTAGTGVLADGANCAGDPLNCASDNCDLVGTGNCIGNEVASISLVISGNKISFNPFNDCPAPYEAWKCFDANATYEIQADDGATGILRQGDGEGLTCSGPFPCSAVFDTGVTIDTQNPSNLSLGISGNLCVDTFNSLAASADDDSGIDFFDFSDSHVGWFHTDNAPVCAGVPPNVTCAGAAVWNPTAVAGYIANNPYTLTLEAMDYDSNMSIINNNITLRQAHCCNDVWDEAEGEEGVDCGGPCAACSGAACGISLFETCAGDPDPNCDDSRCASGFCSCGNHPDGPLPDDSCQEKGYDAVVGNTCCVCEDKPRIDWVTPMGGFCNDDINMPCQEDADCATTCNTDTPNGAVGNFVTIGGRNFGDVAGTVTFCGAGTCADGDEQTADLPNTVNAACSDTWTDSQIIIVVPTGAVEGPIEVEEATTGNNYSDQTGDAYGNFINDFVINTIARPGLCLANPDNGILDDPFNLQGINFAGGVQEVLFGDGSASSILANNIQNWTNTSVDADVPNITDGKTSVFVRVDNIGSNFLDFIKTPEPYSGPYITSFEPTAGSEGQYVTIYGSGFGAAKGISAVYFGDEFGTEANYDFPDVCADSVWSDNQIIIKVPTVADGNYTVTIVIGGSDIINTDDLSPNQFTVDSTLPLAPSLCKIQPIMGPNNSLVSLWGEYFGAVADIVRFHLNQDQSGGAIIFWGTEGDADKIETTVHGGAASGPVKVVQSGLEGNGLNFEVGFCTEAEDPDAACGTDICCPVGSTEEGRCHATIDDCYITVTSSVYEWDFSTAGPTAIGDPCYVDLATTPFCTPTSPNCAAPQFCDPDTCTCQLPYMDSCMGFGQGECADNLCPNSPGNCSPYGGGETVIVGDCDDAECASRFGAGYTYNIILNKCVDGTACDLSETVPDGLGNPIIAYCANYAGAGRWHMDTSASCPVGWSSIGGNQCIEDATVCDYCDSGLSCLDDSGSGICGIDQKICPAGSTCNAGQCEKLDSEVCECCCREPGTGLYDAEDCCVPLICEGDCGADRAVDTDQFGYCSGCALAGTTQAEHDASCNCFHTSGKFCDTSDVDYPEGVCRDCAQLSTTGECALHPATCCADNKQGDVCRGGDGTLVAGGYCAYYDCQLPPDEDLCATTSPVMNAAYSDIFSCESGCGAELPPLPGLSCYDSDTGFCEIVCGTGYDCLGNSGCFDNDPADPRGSCAGGDMTCLCCCDPDPIFDKCSGINSVLTCTPNTDPCDGIERGLCCGCAQDDDCGDPNVIGCGFDGCCRSRPEVIENYPLDKDDPGYAPVVCRNTVIKATFDQEMDVGSFSGKVIVVGDYGSGQCPEGTEFLVKEDAQNKGKLARMIDKIKIFFKKIIKPISYLARAYTSPVPADHNYCAIKGTVSGYNNAADQGELTFSPSQLLDVGREYYVIIKGDSNIADNISEGVLNYYDIGMNGPHTETFNARTYANAYIWSFEVEAEGVTEDGLAGYWKFDEGSGNTAFDSSGNGNDGTLTNMDPTTDWVSGEIGGALEFDGVDDYVSAGTMPNINFSENYTVGLWLKLSRYGDPNSNCGDDRAIIFGKWVDYYHGFALDTKGAASNIRFYHYYDTKLTKDVVSNTVDLDKWIYLTVSVNTADNTMRLFINGIQQDSTSISGVTLTNPSDGILYIGKETPHCSSDYTEGVIDEARIYNRALSAGEIQALYSQGTGQVCELDYVSVNPPSYLFTTAGDTQTFIAQAETSGGYGIAAIPGIYNWSWSWSSDSASVANVVMQAAPNEMFGDVTSQNVKDGKTYIRAEATITEDEINNTVGQSKEGEAQVYVFLCENPWPPIPVSGIWEPWIDTITNCSIPDAGCFDTKYDVYYCRDDGGVGTADDFSAILSDDTGVSGVIRGSSTAQDLLKEIYYLREDIPDVPVSFSAVNNNIAIAGGSVNVNWTIVAGVDGYKIYYGTSAGNYDISIDIDNGAQNNYTVADLMNNTTYYFNLTSYDDTGAESEYISDDVEVFVEDEVVPAAPANLTAIAGDSQIELSWDANIDDTVGYKVYYGTSAGVYGDSQDVGDVIGAVVTGLTNGQVYYFAVTAYDDYDNESGYSVEIDSIPLACDAFTYDDVEYNVIRIGEQCWMAENLNVGDYVASADTGSTHSDVSDNGVIEKYCYDNDVNNCDIYGGLYDWDEMMGYVETAGAQGICPSGWHIPTDAEQYELENYLKDDGETCSASRSDAWDCATAGTKLKSGGTSGFGGLLAGYRYYAGSFYNLTSYGYFWSSSVSVSYAWRRSLHSTESRVDRFAYSQTYGFSVRCVKD